VKQKKGIQRFLLLTQCGLKTRKIKILLAAWMSLFFSGKKLSRLWESASKRKRQMAL